MERGCHVVRRDESATDSASFNDLAPATPTPWRRPRRRWLRYSLRSLLILTTVLCIWLGIKVNQARRQKAAVDTLRALGAQIAYEHQRVPAGYFDSQVDLNVPVWARELCGDDFFQTVRSVAFVSRANADSTKFIPYEIADDDLECLADLPHLERFYIDTAPITDAALVHLAGHKSLTTIYLKYTAINGSGLRHLAVRGLVEIGLEGSPVNDAGLSHLREAKNLQKLQLARTEVTDEGLKHLRGLNKLEGLVVSRTRITGSGLKYISGLAELHEINMVGCPIDGQSLLALKSLNPSTGSILLELKDTPLGDQDISYLIQLKNLWSVSLNRTKVTDAGLAHLHQKTKLQTCYFGIDASIEQNFTARRKARPTMPRSEIIKPKRD
jgi:hypothetical protein